MKPSFKIFGIALFGAVLFVIAQITTTGLFFSDAVAAETKKSKNTTQKKQTKTKWANTAKGANPQLDLNYFSVLFANMNPQERAQVLADAALFKQFVQSEAANNATVSAAKANKLEQDKNIAFLMRRNAEALLRESYINVLLSNKLPSDFPTPVQVAEYYQTNKDQFVIPEQVEVWQIFFSKPDKATKKQIAAIKKKANQVFAKIKGGADFTKTALLESEHAQSRSLGGYMGLLRTDDLLPVLKKTILKLKQEQLSSPIESDTGFHVVKRGKIIAKEQLAFSQIEGEVRQTLLNDARVQLRQAILVQVQKEYPQAIDDQKIDAWRAKLKSKQAAKK